MSKAKATKKKAVPFDEKRFFVWLRSALRSASRRYPPIYEALAAAKRPYVGDNPRQKICYECAACKALVPAKGCAVDHRVDCGSLTSWADVQGFMQRLFCGREGLDILCHSCHDCKTYSYKNNVSLEEAKLMKDVLLILKQPVKQVVAFCEAYGYNSADVSNSDKRKAVVRQILLKEAQ